MRQIVLIIGSFLILLSLEAQDKHFSQFYNSPLTLNPALTGGFNGTYRLATIYRDQGRQLFDAPYSTFAAQIDFMFPIKRLFPRFRNEDRLGVGVLFFNDKVADIDFSTNQMAISLAYHKNIDKSTNQFISIGYQIGLTQRNVNYGNLTFNDQYDGLSDFSGVTQEIENIPGNNFSYGDMNVGINYSISPSNELSVFAGLAYHHFNQPEVSFYANDESEIINSFGSYQLASKTTAHVAAIYKISPVFHILPRARYMMQGPSQEVNLGANLKFVFNDYNNSSFYFGGWTRLVANEAAFPQNLEAFIVQAGVDLGGFNLSVAYDLSLSTASRFQRTDGTLEFSIIYTGEPQGDDDFIICPEF